jgi:DNA modification methylase
MTAVFREVRRVLRDDGTLWLNLGDSYATFAGRAHSPGGGNQGDRFRAMGAQVPDQKNPGSNIPVYQPNRMPIAGLKPKDLVGIPWRVAFALQADGWWLRSDIIWAKPNPMPESVTDGPTRAHEYVFLLAKAARYYYDAEAVREAPAGYERKGGSATYTAGGSATHGIGSDSLHQMASNGRNKRTVWTVTTRGFPGAHFATFPPALVEPMVKAGTSERGACPVCGAVWEREVERTSMVIRTSEKGAAKHEVGLRTSTSGTMIEPSTSHTTGWRPTCSHDAEPVPCTVLDPFSGAATVGVVCQKLGRRYVGLDLSLPYCRMGRERLELNALAAWNDDEPASGHGASMDTLPLFEAQEQRTRTTETAVA